jgi:hypothetical protein
MGPKEVRAHCVVAEEAQGLLKAVMGRLQRRGCLRVTVETLGYLNIEQRSDDALHRGTGLSEQHISPVDGQQRCRGAQEHSWISGPAGPLHCRLEVDDGLTLAPERRHIS